MLRDSNYEELVSIIIPIYNVEKYLKDCMESVINQTYKNIEIILVNDGSTDSSGDICEFYAKNDNRVMVIHKENGGLSDARNVGIKNSKGSYVSLVDSDDIVSENFIQTLYEVQKLTGSDIICCEMICFYDEDKYKIKKYWDRCKSEEVKKDIYSSEDMIEKSFYQHISITGAPQKLYKKSLFEELKFPEGRYFEDLATTFLFFEKANYVSVIDKKLYGYRMRVDSIMNNSFNERKLDCIWVGNRIVEFYKNTDIKGAECAAFRVNRLVYDQIPHKLKKEKLAVWDEIKKYRKSIIFDKKVHFYEKIIAICSYSGKYLFDVWLFLFRKFREIKYRTIV